MRLGKCPHCSTEFETTHGLKRYCSSSCQTEHGSNLRWEKIKTKHTTRLSFMYSGAKNRAKAKNLPFDITPEYLIEIWEKQAGLCAVSGLVFDLSKPEIKGQPRWNAPSLDRIKPELGYVKGNLRLVVYQINVAINEFGLDHFLKLCATVHNLNRI